jgi:hypothetical protein
MQKIFRAMQKYGLIVADNGSDMYITGTYDTRWNNDILNPAFSNLMASDFEVIQLGYNPPPVGQASLNSLAVNPSSVTGGQSATGTVGLSGPAPANGALVTLSSANPAATVPSSVTVPANATSANFTVSTTAVGSTTLGNITAAYSGVAKSATLAVNPSAPAALSTVTLSPTTVVGGSNSIGTVTLTKAAPAGGLVVTLASNRPTKALVPANVTVPAGASSAGFNVATTAVNKKTIASISASYGGVTKSATLTLQKINFEREFVAVKRVRLDREPDAFFVYGVTVVRTKSGSAGVQRCLAVSRTAMICYDSTPANDREIARG